MEFLSADFRRPVFTAEQERLRDEVRAFLAEEFASGRIEPACNAWVEGFSAPFSRALGGRGYIGRHWPARYGGRDGTAFDTFIINEELLAAGAPVNAHWTGARQSAPVIMRFAGEELRRRILPRIAAGELYFAIGLSEPNSGSDLASVRTRAVSDGNAGWVLSGRKVWTSSAHRCHYMMVLCRTTPLDEAHRHDGLTQMIVDLQDKGVTITPIRTLDGAHHFNEVVFDDVRVPNEMVVGEPGDAWRQVSSELAYERSGPERFLSSMPMIDAFMRAALGQEDRHLDVAMGRMLARLMTLRGMSLGVAGMLDAGRAPDVEAAMVKDLGAAFEHEGIEAVRLLAADLADDPQRPALKDRLREAIHAGPTYTIRGGTTEILRNIIGKRLQQP